MPQELDLVGKNLSQLRDLKVHYIIEAEVKDGITRQLSDEDDLSWDTYYITVKDGIVVKSSYSGTGSIFDD